MPRQRVQAGKLYAPPGKLQMIYFIDDLNMPALDKYNTQSVGNLRGAFQVPSGPLGWWLDKEQEWSKIADCRRGHRVDEAEAGLWPLV